MTERIEQKVKSGRIFTPTKKRGFKAKRKKADHVKGGHRGRKNQIQNYHTSPQIVNINLNSLFPTKKTWDKKRKKEEKHSKLKAKITKGFKNNYLITTTLKWDVPKAVEYRACSSKTIHVSATTLS